MTITANELKKISELACLELPREKNALIKEINDIMTFVEKLRAADTTHAAPLFHPFDLHQRLRDDIVTEESCLEELAQIAPEFDDGLYMVPKVIDAGE